MISPFQSFKLLSTAIVLTAVVALSGQAVSEPLYTVDTGADSLYVIESATGAVLQGVGPLGVNASYCHELVSTSSGSLYAILAIVGATEPRVCEISRANGTVLWQTPIPYPYCEAIELNPASGQMMICFGGVPTSSNHLGRIDLETGALTDLGPLQMRPDNEDDVESIRYSDTGVLYAMDARCCGRGSDLYVLNGLVGTYIGSTPSFFSNLNAMEFLSNGTLITLDTSADALVTLSTVTGAPVTAVFLTRLNYSGIARMRSGAVSTVSTTWGRVKSTYR